MLSHVSNPAQHSPTPQKTSDAQESPGRGLEACQGLQDAMWSPRWACTPPSYRPSPLLSVSLFPSDVRNSQLVPSSSKPGRICKGTAGQESGCPSITPGHLRASILAQGARSGVPSIPEHRPAWPWQPRSALAASPLLSSRCGGVREAGVGVRFSLTYGSAENCLAPAEAEEKQHRLRLQQQKQQKQKQQGLQQQVG